MNPKTKTQVHHSKMHLWMCSAFLALLSTGILQSTAQDADEEDIYLLDPFTVDAVGDDGYLSNNSVSGTRIATPIRELPLSLNAFNESFIQDVGARDLFDVIKFAPGVTHGSSDFTNGNARFMIRGFLINAPQRNGFTGADVVDMTNIERVEIAKGPSSLLYGQIGPGGVVNYITKRPQSFDFTRATLTAGSHTYLRGMLDYNKVLVKDKLSFRINGSYENNFRIVDPYRSMSTVYAPSLKWEITKNTSLIVEYEKFSRKEDAPLFMKANSAIGGLTVAQTFQNPGFLPHYPLPRDWNYPNINDYRDRDYSSFGVQLNQKLGDNWTSRFNFGSTDSWVSNRLTGIATANLTIPAGMTAADFADMILHDPDAALLAPSAKLPRRKRLEVSDASTKTFQAEFAGVYDFGSSVIKPLVGFWYNEAENTFLRRQSTGSAPKGVANADIPNNNPFQDWDLKDPTTWDQTTDYDEFSLPINTFSGGDNEDRAVYAALNANLMDDKMYIMGGFRYADSKATGYNFRNNTSQSFEVQKTVPQLGVGYRLNEDIMIYASYSESFVANNAFLQTLGITDLNKPADPTTASSFEIGAKFEMNDGALVATVSAYSIKQDGRIVRFTEFLSDGTTAITTNQGVEDTSNGFELELNAKHNDQWQSFITYSYTDSTIDSAPPALEPLIGSPTPDNAKHLFNLWTRYNFYKPGSQGWWLGAGANYQGKKAQRADNIYLYFDAYTLFDMVIGYDWTVRDMDFSVKLDWKNMTDEEYFPTNNQRGYPSRMTLSLGCNF